MRLVNRQRPPIFMSLCMCCTFLFGADADNHKAYAQDQNQAVTQESKDTPAALNFTMQTLSGETKKLSDFDGKVILVVNTASKCGLTPQYAELQSLYSKYSDQGLVVLGFPCNQFGGQEPGTAKEISEFCTANYGVTFPMFAKIDVNGDGACDLYKYLTKLETKPAGPGKITWNFEKFLINRNGEVVARFAPRTKPDAEEVLSALEKELKAGK